MTDEKIPQETDRTAAHRADEATWPRVTDCDRLHGAFAELEADGVLVRQNFSCCMSCGFADMYELLDQAGPHVRGFTFYHEQDTEAAVAGHGLYLAFGTKTDRRADIAAIGDRVVAALLHHGLAPEWNRDIDRRIHVPMVWRMCEVSAGHPVAV